MNRKTISDLITIDEVKNWKEGEVITISAQMGYGKSYFIKNRLYEIAKENNQKIILLVHRTRCKQQIIQELEENNK
ncbi:restriction endonuclease subunit R, partial [Clostridium perfringens]|nr:restriction endonuclease subunit R [Clostridium perfringens]